MATDPQQTIKLTYNWQLGKGGVFIDQAFVMTQELLKEIKESGLVETGEQISMVELGAATMLPCLAAALNYSQCTCFATDVASVLPQMEETCKLNGNPPNVVPMAFKFGSTGTSLLDLKKLIEKRSLKRVDYIVCVEQIYD